MISLIFPTFNEQDNLNELYERLNTVTKNFRDHTFEFFFIDDGSTDRTPEILKALHEKDKRVKVIRFARNCGSHAALAAGLMHCRGDCAINLSADLQDPPELILDLVKEWGKKTSKIIWGVRTKREGESKRKRFFAKVYYFLLHWLTDVKIPPSGTDIFLADRSVIEAYKEMTEKHTSVFMALSWLGFPQSSIEYVRGPRHGGRSKWTLTKQWKLAIDSILSFSDLPIRYMSILGFLTAFLGFIYCITVIWGYFHGNPVEGWSSLIVTILMISGIQMMMLGILGEYLWRTYDESPRMPNIII